MEEKNKKTNVSLFALLCLTYFTFSLITNIPGVLLPYWNESFHLSSVVLTLLGAVFFLAYGLTGLPQGLLLDKIGNKKIFLWGISLIFLGSLMFAIVPKYIVGLISLFIIGIGVTALQIVANLLVKAIDEDEEKYARNMSLTTVFTGIGGLGGGFLIGYLIKDLGFQWQAIYYIFTALAIICAIWVFLTNIPEVEETEKKPTYSDYLNLAKNPLMIMFAMGIFIYVGIEVGIATWISTYLIDKFDMLKESASKINSFYWGFLAVGRFTGGILLNYVNTSKALIAYATCAFISLVCAVLAPTCLISAICFIAVGFFLSIMFPSIFALCINAFDKSQEGTVAGILCTTIVGGAVTAPVIGALSSLTNSLSIALVIVAAISFGYIGFIGIKTLPKKQ